MEPRFTYEPTKVDEAVERIDVDFAGGSLPDVAPERRD